MASKKIDLQKYFTAIMMVKDAAASSTPIKRTEFIAKRELTPLFFRVMEDLNIIKEISQNNLFGSVFTWKYQQASNESDSRVAIVVTDKIHAINQAAYLKYSSPAHKAKKKVITQAIRRPKKGSTDSKEIWNGESIKIVTDTPVAYLVEEQIQEQNEIPAVDTAIEDKKPIHTKVSFEFAGDLSREDLINKILALVNDNPISSFSLGVNYK